MKKLLLLLLTLSSCTLALKALDKSNIFKLDNTTNSKIEVKLRLGSTSETYTLQPSEKKKIVRSSLTCLNSAKAFALDGELAGKEDKIADVKGCSGKTILFTNQSGKLKMVGLKVDTSAELGNKDKYLPAETTKSDTTPGTTDNFTEEISSADEPFEGIMI